MGILDNPMALLAMRANPSTLAQAGTVPANTPAQNSPPTQPQQNSQPQAQAPSAPINFGMANLGTRISQAVSGERGLFAGAGDPTADAVVDPMTGVPAGAMRKINNQSMMKFGLMLMAAGTRQSDDSRARVLAAVGDAADTSGQINAFAANRLEMAKLKLLEKKQVEDTASLQAMNTMMGGGSIGAQGAFPAAPASATGVSPMGAPGSTPAAPSVPVVPSAHSAERGRDTSLANPPVNPAGAATPPNAIVLDPQLLPTEAPAAPNLGQWQPNDGDRAAFAVIPDLAGKQKYIADRIKNHSDQEITTEPYFRPGIGVVADTYKNGRKVETKKLGDASQTVVAVKNPDGSTTYETRNSITGAVEAVKNDRDPVADDLAKRRRDVGTDGSRVIYDDKGNPVRQEALPGSKAEREANAAATAKNTKSANDAAKADNVLRALDSAIGLVDTETWKNPVTGPTGAIAANVAGSNRATFDEYLNTINANIAFDRIGQMRAESPTGGALGSVTEGELALLRSTIASISPNMSKDALRQNLNFVRAQYENILAKAQAYPNANKFGFGEGGAGAGVNSQVPNGSGDTPPAQPAPTKFDFGNWQKGDAPPTDEQINAMSNAELEAFQARVKAQMGYKD